MRVMWLDLHGDSLAARKGLPARPFGHVASFLHFEGICCAVRVYRLLEHGAKDMSELQLLVAPMSDTELLQVGAAPCTVHDTL